MDGMPGATRSNPDGMLTFRSRQVDIIYKPKTPTSKSWVETKPLPGKVGSHVSFEEKFYELLLIAQCEEDGQFPSTKKRSTGELFKGKHKVIDFLRECAVSIKEMPPSVDPQWLKDRWLPTARRLGIRHTYGPDEGKPKSVVNFMPPPVANP